MSRRRRPLPSTSSRGSGSSIATLVVMSALLVALLATQRGISRGLSEIFVDVTEGSGETAPPPRPENTVRLGIDTTTVAFSVARLKVQRAVSSAIEETRGHGE